MRSKAFISVLIALSMLLAFGVVKNAQADQLIFPWIVKSSSVSTIVSVVNTAGTDLGWSYLGADQQLHYQYWYKISVANGQTETCTNQSFKRPTSKDDLVVFDASANINAGKALYGDAARYGDQSFKLSAENPRRAFLIVDNDTPFFQVNNDNEDGTLYGEAMVIELSGGAAWGYIAYNPSQVFAGPNSSQTSAVLAYNGLDTLGEVIGGSVAPTANGGSVAAMSAVGAGELVPVVLNPAQVGTTKFFMTPVDNWGTPADAFGLGNDVLANDNNAANQRTGNANARIQMIYPQDGQVDCDPITTDCYYGGVFDDDENPIDFTKSKNIVCTSADNLQDIMTEGAWNEFVSTAGPGWGLIDVQTGTVDANSNLRLDNPTDDMIIGKLEFTTGGITIDGYAIPGTFNNFNWLRNARYTSTATTTTDICTSSAHPGINCINNVIVDLLP